MAWISEFASVQNTLNYFECGNFSLKKTPAFTEELFMSVFKYTRPVFTYVRPEHVHICLSGTKETES